MQNDDIAKQIIRWIALGALFLIPFMPLVVASSFFFPFISGKAFYFRILVDIVVCAWVALALLDKEYRPRISAVGIAVLAFVGWMFIANLFAINVEKAFWSNFERMEGWILLIHLLGFFFAISSILRAEKKWRAWFLASLGVSVIISCYALLQINGSLAIHQGSTRIDATLGNSAYLAIYFLFSVFVSLWLALTEKYSWLKWSLIALALLEAILIFFTETRGAILGLLIAFALVAFLTMLTAGKRARRFATSSFFLIILLAGSFYLARGSDFVQNNHILQRIASISLADGQTRFTLWHMALRGVSDRPIVGWGQEGFNYVFNTYYDPSLFAQEPWFDRAHNTFIDWLIAGGVPAFLLYLSLFGSAFFVLWRSSELSRPERIALTGALVGYAIHNFFVFDNLYSYVYFFALLALIDSQTGRPIECIENVPVLNDDEGMIYALPVMAVASIALIWMVNVSGMQVGTKLITALSPSAGGVTTNIRTFEELVTHPSFAGQEIREQLVSFASSLVRSSSISDVDKKRVVELAIREMQKQVAQNPRDARGRLQLSYAYSIGGDSVHALKEIKEALRLSPTKEQMWIEAGIAEWNQGNIVGAQTNFNTAYKLGPQFQDLAAYAAAGNVANDDIATADKILLGAYGTTTIDSDILSVAYYRTKNWKRLVDMWRLRTTNPNATADKWFGLAAAQYTAGDPSGAIATINIAMTRFPDTASAGAATIAQIKAKPISGK
jgi:O-antigen ligase